MPDIIDAPGSDASAQGTLRADRHALRAIVRARGTCEATGKPLDVADAVAMTVTVRPGVNRTALVSARYWDHGTGPLSGNDPDVHPNVLDGRKLFGSQETATRRPQRPPYRVTGVAAVQRPRPQAQGGTGILPRA
jgi:hypothetical protein